MARLLRCSWRALLLQNVPRSTRRRVIGQVMPSLERNFVTLGSKRITILLQKRTGMLESHRCLWGYLNAVANRPDRSRIQEVGPQRACAEWLLRCGAHVRWEGFDSFQTDYNKLPSGGFQKFKIVEINADNASVMELGFAHFDGVKSVRKIRFHFCTYMGDDALKGLHRLKDTLEEVEISSCGDVTDDGITSLTQLSKLKDILLCDLPAVRNKAETLKTLQQGLPNCRVVFKDLERGSE